MKPDYTEAHFNLGNLAHFQKRDDDAEEHFLAALKLLPNHAGALVGLAEVARDRGDKTGEKYWLDRLLAIEPQNAVGLLMQAEMKASATASGTATGGGAVQSPAASDRPEKPQ